MQLPRRRRALAAAAVAVTLSAAPSAACAQRGDPVLSAAGAVRVDTVRAHLKALARIADAHGGTRAAGTPGYAASRDYLIEQLREAGYRPVVQEFDVPYFREDKPAELIRTGPAELTYTPTGTDAAVAGDFTTMTYSGSGDVTAPVRAVDAEAPAAGKASTSGCETADFAGFGRGEIALLRRGTCPFHTKAKHAQDAGAAAVVIFNDGGAKHTDAVSGTLGEPGKVTVPVLGASAAVGGDLAAPGTTARIVTATTSSRRTTWNVLAETDQGAADRVVMVGAHFDSVPEGPGINDNGSGAAALLEVARYAREQPARNRLRFAWWGAEELGLLGSAHYVDALSAAERAKIRVYLNHDMIASPNHVYGIYDGDDSDRTGEGPGPEGSGRIEQVYADYFDTAGLPHQGSDFTGRSDYGPFIARGIPSGGLFTGAEGRKTEAEAARFGGTAGQPYDACYHRACDTLDNLNTTALGVNLRAMAHTALAFAAAADLPARAPKVVERSAATTP
ncbi:PA domain-containing protein [Actinocorallia herbida]|uniref:PA domain-containing protein n=1 Tax=Actinocorallia herbida TaxID=58109 RepID=A0A3N1CS30_9ACTN|nr:M28 family peptidase [Actinocorallia herbida]ROO84126.1 PA domain-containing protein [Actinocorallia herbida]